VTRNGRLQCGPASRPPWRLAAGTAAGRSLPCPMTAQPIWQEMDPTGTIRAPDSGLAAGPSRWGWTPSVPRATDTPMAGMLNAIGTERAMIPDCLAEDVGAFGRSAPQTVSRLVSLRLHRPTRRRQLRCRRWGRSVVFGGDLWARLDVLREGRHILAISDGHPVELALCRRRGSTSSGGSPPCARLCY